MCTFIGLNSKLIHVYGIIFRKFPYRTRSSLCSFSGHLQGPHSANMENTERWMWETKWTEFHASQYLDFLIPNFTVTCISYTHRQLCAQQLYVYRIFCKAQSQIAFLRHSWEIIYDDDETGRPLYLCVLIFDLSTAAQK